MPKTITTTIITTIPTTILTNIYTTLATNIPITISTTIPKTTNISITSFITTLPSTIKTTISTNSKILTTFLITKPTNKIITTIPTKIITNIPLIKTSNTTTNLITNISNTIPTTKTNILTTIPNNKNINNRNNTYNLTTTSNTISTNISYIIITTILNSSSTTKSIINSTTNIIPNSFQTNTSSISTTLSEIIPTGIPTTNEKTMFATIANIPTISQKNTSKTIPFTISTKIQTTFPTIPNANSTNVNNNIPPVISTDLSNTNIKPNDEYSQNEIITKQKISSFQSSIIDELILPTTNIETNVISTLLNITEKTDLIPIINNEETLLIIIGLNLFKIYESFFSFNIYFTPIRNIIYSNTLIFTIIITYYTNIRSLKELKVNCTLAEINTDSKYKYFCKVEADTYNIKQIKILPDFKFVSQENIKLIGITPFAKIYMDNVQLLDEKFDYIDNSTIYILDNSSYTKYDKNLFDIFGSIKNPQPIFENKDLLVMINVESDKKYYNEAECNITNITGHNYTLFCRSNETFDGDLQSALSFINNGNILIINFAINNINNSSKINIESKRINNRFYYKNKVGDNISTIIVTIVIIIAIASIIGLILYLKIKKTKSKCNEESNTSQKCKFNSIYEFENI